MVAKCLGIPVRYDPDLQDIVQSRGIWRWKEIVIGPKFTAFPPREQQAFLLHEAGHCKRRHLERRLLRAWLLLWSPARLAALCREQEFEADRFVLYCGYGADLARGLWRLVEVSSPLHPPVAERINRLSTPDGC